MASRNSAAIGVDKQSHFFASYGAALSVSHLAQGRAAYPELWGFGTALALGLAKELRDREISRGDLSADFLGAMSGAIFHYTIKF